jgi:nucleotide-binding universal stress UspA family protein
MIYFENQIIVAPFDFSEPATKALRTALEMFDDSCVLHVIHVVEPTPTIISFDPSMPVPPSYDEERKHQAKTEMESMFSKGEFERFQVVACKLGDPGKEIVNYAKDVGANMIIMSSHGRTGLAHLFLGSVSERVLRLATCPVLTLRSEKQS